MRKSAFSRGVAVIGLGYIGLPTGAVLASHGVQVHGVDVNATTVSEINAGRTPIVEPDLDVAVSGAVAQGRLVASTTVPEADVYLIAVPTPFREGKTPDLSYVEQAVAALAPRLRGGEVVILESTSPPGTTRQISMWLAEHRPDLTFPHDHPDAPDVCVAHCPERVLPGRIMIEMVANDRLVGGLTPRCAEKAADVYRVFCLGEVVLTDAASAEMAKLVENSFRDVNIAFANEIAAISEQLGLDVWEIIELANRHPRVDVLKPGPGVGGHCIAVDPWFIVAAAPESARLVRTAREINDARPREVVGSVSAATGDAASVACLGLSFKADIDDLRESPAVEVVRELVDVRPDIEVLAVEPHVTQLPTTLRDRPRVRLAQLETALEEAEVVVLLVDHTAFRRLDPADLAGRTVIDTRGVWRGSTPRP